MSLVSPPAGRARFLPPLPGVLQHQRSEERLGHRGQLLPEHHPRRVPLCGRLTATADPETHTPSE